MVSSEEARNGAVSAQSDAAGESIAGPSFGPRTVRNPKDCVVVFRGNFSLIPPRSPFFPIFAPSNERRIVPVTWQMRHPILCFCEPDALNDHRAVVRALSGPRNGLQTLVLNETSRRYVCSPLSLPRFFIFRNRAFPNPVPRTNPRDDSFIAAFESIFTPRGSSRQPGFFFPPSSGERSERPSRPFSTIQALLVARIVFSL